VRVRGIHHVGLVVADLDAAVAFYSALLDMEVVERDSWSAPAPDEDRAVGLVGSSAEGAMLRGSDSYIELWEYTTPGRLAGDPAEAGAHELGLRHLAIEVDDVHAALDMVTGLGGSRMGEPVEMPDGGATVVYCRDPFGTIIELMSTGGSMASLDDL
jgi:catechol 2,3-dioxygenase-like lactoylglutathione lyase family enzyme